ncbi:uncharacterized protein PFL1_04001 [Pseudozyma flocculosa PF-1]|uniref:Related to UV-damaged DNA-binding protein n=2 Tax=Pseudozyma flocculosa TaxID=84751 RepID=A0A5C3EWM6_9BASI|nr:uncharacterized protein PFL1_04001 [Pseudozyma flocculosa PF-1]EPQ28698.1 hypothetical protein PFL1_04001 [Pseudozyma flocculosa PF-1]SPO36654.1 related to UV-damaged DNA-binding protein [Pseudozyma flocculosa]
MLYLSHAHKASATLQSLVLPDFLPSGPSLAVVHHSSIVFLALPRQDKPAPALAPAPAATQPLQQVASVELNARILAVKSIAAPAPASSPSGTQTQAQPGSAPRPRAASRLLVLTDHHNPRFVVLAHSARPDLGDNAILTESTLVLDEPARPPAELGLDLLVEPASLHAPGARFAATHTHSGLLRILPIATGGSDKKTSARRRSSALPLQHGIETDADTAAVTAIGPANDIGRPDTARAFGVRLPHPTLISSTFLHPRAATDPATLALLSLSSVPSRNPGLGQQCLPVLSFHAVDQGLQELKPLPWGPPRRAPSAIDHKADAPPRRSSMPGSYAADEEDDGDPDYVEGAESSRRAAAGRAKSAKRPQPESKGKGRGPSAMGAHLDAAALQKREEQWAKDPLTRAHVPLPYTDALGAHLIHALPASAGGGVIVFSETSILVVPPPSSGSTSADIDAHDGSAAASVQAPSDSGSAAGKRRKGSNATESAHSRRTSAAGSTDAPSSSGGVPAATPDALSTSPTVPSSRSNENGKRRRSSAMAPASSPPTSPTATRSSAGRKSVHLLRTSLPFPVQVSAATTVVEADGSSVVVADDGAPGSAAYLHVLFACSSGSLKLLKIKLAKAASQASGQWRPVGLSVHHLGSTPQATGPNALTYLGEGFVHISSTTGDAVLYRIDHEPSEGAAPSARPGRADDDGGDVEMITPPTSPTHARSRMPPPSMTPSSLSDAGSLPSAGRLVEVRRWDNLGPIVDFTVDDGSGQDPAGASSAQARIITCSGSGPTSSLRVVKTGVAMDEVAELDGLAGASRVWTLHAGRRAARTTTMLAVAHAAGVRFLEFQADGSTADITAAVIGASGASTTSSSVSDVLAISSLDARSAAGDAGDQAAATTTRFVVVDRAGIRLYALQNGQVAKVSEWLPTTDGSATAITNAAVNEQGQVLVGLKDHSLVYVEAGGDDHGIREVSRTALQNEVACMDISPLQPSRPAAHCAIAMWGSMSAQILSLPALKPVGQSAFASERLPSLPRSIVIHRFGDVAEDTQGTPSSPAGPAYLLIGLGDGTLLTYRLGLPDADSYSDTVGVYDQKAVSLGTRALRLDKVQTSEGLLAVSVAGERPTIVFADARRFSFSAIKYRAVRSTATLYGGAGQPALGAFAVAEGVRVATVGALQKLDIRTVPLGCHQPLAIAPHPAAKAFGLVTWTFVPQASAAAAAIGSQARGAVRLLDQSDLATLDEVQLEAFERPNCVDVVALKGRRTYLVVGTGYVRPDASETTKGRLIGYEIVEGGGSGSSRERPTKSRRALRLAFEEEVGGNVYAVVGIQGRIAAAINSRVAVYEANGAAADPSGKGKARSQGGGTGGGLDALVQTGEWGSAFVACTLSTAEDNRLLVGDALRSMNILEVDTERGTVSEVARDCDPFWTTATEVVDRASQTFIGADVGFNLYTTQRVQLGDDERRRIKKKRDAELESGQRNKSRWNERSLADGFAHVMQRQAAWHYGDMINRFRKGALTSPSGNTASIVTPRLVFATAAGAIGVISQLDEHVGPVLSQLERNIISVVEASPSFSPAASGGVAASSARHLGIVGSIPFSEYRTLRTDHRVQPPAGIVDGDVLRLFTDGRLDDGAKKAVLDGPAGEAGRIDKRNEVQRWCEELALLG